MPTDYQALLDANLEEYGKGTRHLEIYRSQYADHAHFLLELLQNAEDAGASNVEFLLKKDSLELRHNGRPFTEKDVRSICSIGESTKKNDLTSIGRFGIGFKSVYAYSDSPEIHSGDEHFRVRSFIRPEQADPITDGGFSTFFLFPFDLKEVPPKLARTRILEGLMNLSTRTLLFLDSIERVRWKAGAEGATLTRKRHDEQEVTFIEVMARGTNGQSKEDWIAVGTTLPEPNSELQIQLAFKATVGEKVRRIQTLTESPLHVFFPTARETHMGFLVQGPFRTTPARDNVPLADDWNQQIIHQLGTLLRTALPRLKGAGFLEPGAFDCLPFSYSDHPNDPLYKRMNEALDEALSEDSLLPTATGSFCRSEQAASASTDALISLIRPNQLSQILGDPVRYWLHPKLSGHVRGYCVDELGSTGLSIGAFASALDRDFLGAQTDAWIRQLYGFWNDRREFWSGRGGTKPVLRPKPIIRLSDGRHVPAFKDDESPAAWLPSDEETDFPTVRASVLSSKQARAFVEFIGLNEADITAEVVEVIVPRYFKEPLPSKTEHQHHLRRIKASLATDSIKKREAVTIALKKTPFCLGGNAATQEVRYCLPTDLYFESPRLSTYFSDNDNAWFLMESTRGWPWTELGVAQLPRRIKGQGLTHNRKLEISGGWSRDLGSVDYELDGLTRFLARFKNLDFQEAVTFSECLWTILADHIKGLDEWDAGAFFEGEFNWFYYSTHSKHFPAIFCDRLKRSKWLPSSKRTIVKPSAISLDDLPQTFVRNETLSEALGMKPPLVTKVAQQLGLSGEDLAFLMQHPIEFKKFKESILAKEQESLVPEETETPAIIPEESSEARSLAPSEYGGDGPHKEVSNDLGPNHPATSVEGLVADGEKTRRDSAERESEDPAGQRRLISYVEALEGSDNVSHSSEELLALEERAIEEVLAYEQRNGRSPERQAQTNPGFDVISKEVTGNSRFIEVKAVRGGWGSRGVGISTTQYEKARECGDQFWLYVVDLKANALYRIKNPALQITNYFFDQGWKDAAELGEN